LFSKIFIVLTAFCLISFAFGSVAFSEVYVSGNVGMMTLPDFDHSTDFTVGGYDCCANSIEEATFSTISGTSTVSYDFERGYSFSGAIGTKLYDVFRVEFEIGYIKNDFDVDFGLNLDTSDRPSLISDDSDLSFNYDNYTLNNNIDSYSHVDGEIETWTYLCNFYYDLKISKKMYPFIGVGLGVADARAKLDYVYDSTTVEKTAFAYQVMAGISYSLGEKTNLDVQYRYLKINEDDFLDPHFDFEYQGIMLGFRRAF
jgi:opacity protein-like surface antigen